MKEKDIKLKKKVDVDKTLLVCLLIGCILCLLLGIILFIMGIRKLIPVILILFLSFISSLVILLLSRDVFLTKRAKGRRKKQNYA